MKSVHAPHYLKYLALGAGLAGCFLRTAVYLLGTDAKGLPVGSHWAYISLSLLTLAAGLFFLLRCRKLPAGREYRDAYPRSLISAAGSLAAAAALFLADAPDTLTGTFYTAELILRYGAALSMAAVAFCRCTGRKPLFLFHSLVCIYLMLRLVCLYRLWSADPQLIDYGFYLCAYVTAVLTAYQLAAFDAGCGNHGKLWFYGLASLFLCSVSLSGPREPLFMLFIIIWIMTNLSCLKIRSEETAHENP